MIVGSRLTHLTTVQEWFKAILKDGKEQKMQGFNGVQEFYYNDLEELEYLRKQVYEAGMA